MTIINAADKFFDPFAEHAGSPILSPVVARDLKGLTVDGGATLPVHGMVGNYTVRDGKPVFLGVVSESYEIVQMRDIVRSAEDAMRQFFTPDQLRTVKVRDCAAFNGAVVERRYTVHAFEKAVTYEGRRGLNVGTTLAAELRLRTGYDGGTKTSLATGTLDLVCTNGMVAMKATDAIAKKHTRNNTIDVFKVWLTDAVPQFEASLEEARRLAQTELRWSDVEEVIPQLPGMSERRAQQMLARIQTEVRDRGLNAYAVLSGFTYYSSHNSDEFPVRNTGNDNVLTALSDREAEVRKWTASPVFQQLLAA